MRSYSVKTKIVGAFAILTACMLLIGSIGYRNSTQASDAMTEIFDNYFEAEAMLADITLDQAVINGEIASAAMLRSAAATSSMHNRVDELREKIKQQWEKYEPTVTTPEERKLADAFIDSRKQLVEQNNRIIQFIDASQYDQALALYGNSKTLLDATDAAGKQLLIFQLTTGRAVADSAQTSANKNNVWMLTFIIAAMVAAVVIARFLITTITRSLNRAVQIAETIASGRLDNDVQVDTQDEFGRLLEALRAMDAKLSEIVGQVATGANAVGTAAQQLAQGNDDLSSRTQEQASALEETASSMEQMTATVKQTADNARHASQLAAAARTQANESGSVVSAAVNAMNEINKSSRRIADIISVIDEIAFQTNLLALNAAVEAARAGEQGRGFAVVASEVRNLAQRSATAAKEIKGLINDSVQKVADGTALVDKSGQTLADIVDGIKKLTDVVEEISAAAHEQAQGIDQVNNAVTQMDQTTQQNAALVEESTSASRAMEQHAQELVQTVGFFQTQRQIEAATINHKVQPMRKPQRNARTTRATTQPSAARAAAAAPIARVAGGGSSWTEF